MKLLDLFCGAGIGADGYSRAGFEVVGIDINFQPSYPYEFYQADALQWLRGSLSDFDVIHASPPCQLFTRAGKLREAQGGVSSSLDLLTPTLSLLSKIEIPWVVENVPGAPGMEDSVVVCGSAFGLGVRRHRLFLSNIALEGTTCKHREQGRPWGVYHIPGDSIPAGGRTAYNVEHGREVMGVTRNVTWNELKEGIPPAYTEWIGLQIKDMI